MQPLSQTNVVLLPLRYSPLPDLTFILLMILLDK